MLQEVPGTRTSLENRLAPAVQEIPAVLEIPGLPSPHEGRVVLGHLWSPRSRSGPGLREYQEHPIRPSLPQGPRAHARLSAPGDRESLLLLGIPTIQTAPSLPSARARRSVPGLQEVQLFQGSREHQGIRGVPLVPVIQSIHEVPEGPALPSIQLHPASQASPEFLGIHSVCRLASPPLYGEVRADSAYTSHSGRWQMPRECRVTCAPPWPQYRPALPANHWCSYHRRPA